MILEIRHNENMEQIFYNGQLITTASKPGNHDSQEHKRSDLNVIPAKAGIQYSDHHWYN